MSFLLNFGNKITEEKVKSISVYHILHYIWLVEIYYLVINALYQCAVHSLGKIELTQVIPIVIIKFNNEVMNLLQEWNPFILTIGAGLFVSAFFVSMSKHIFFIKNSGIIFYHADAGFHFSKWLIMIALTYFVYDWTGKFLPLVIFLLLLLTLSLEKFGTFLKTKYGITLDKD
ncbi:hypothetical protein [Brevibacillus borstelensis]|uniref:hypothetical protein n=1 Tax=Brevibacillus borstelensis TaxID=45462 RepID=UPI001FAA6185|nr:hypothetical protein [Brevibacillus borstelensis]